VHTLPLFALHRSQAQRPSQAQQRMGIQRPPITTPIQFSRAPKKSKPSAAARPSVAEKGVSESPPTTTQHSTPTRRRKPSAVLRPPNSHARRRRPGRAQRPGRALRRRGVRRVSPDYDNPTRTHAKECQAERSREREFGGLC